MPACNTQRGFAWGSWHAAYGGTFALYSLLCRSIGIAPHGSALMGSERRHLLAMDRGSGPRLLSRSYQGRHGTGQQQGGWRGALHFAALDGSRVRSWIRRHPSAQSALLLVTLAATGMVMGDGVLTPAISVMSAVSGLSVVTEVSQQTIVGVSNAILILLFLVQSQGTRKVGSVFGPIIILWLLSNAAIAAYNLATYGAGALAGLNPAHIVTFFMDHGREAWAMLGGVMLAITGAEAMFADLGHFSHRAVAISYGCVAYPCLMLTYFGQGAFLIHYPDQVGNTFWACVPPRLTWPMLVLATLASVVASQALITGSFSIVRQAIRLGAIPRLRVVHTDEQQEGQVYIAAVNYTLMLLCVAVVSAFKDTVALGLAYGVAVMSVMVITTCLVALVMVAVWEVSLLLVLPFFLLFFSMEAAYLSATLFKVPDGGWFSLAVASVLVLVNLVWISGNRRKARVLASQASSLTLQDLFATTPAGPAAAAAAAAAAAGGAGTLPSGQPGATGVVVVPRPRPLRPLVRLPGIGVYYSDSVVRVPHVLCCFLQKVPVIHDVSLFVNLRVLPLPLVDPSQRLLVHTVPGLNCVYQVLVRYGYMEEVVQDGAFLQGVVRAIFRAIQESREAGSMERASRVRRELAEEEAMLRRALQGDTAAPPADTDDDDEEGEAQGQGEAEAAQAGRDEEQGPGPRPPNTLGDIPLASASAALAHLSRGSARAPAPADDGDAPPPAPAIAAGARPAGVPPPPPASDTSEKSATQLLETAHRSATLVAYLGQEQVRIAPGAPLLWRLAVGHGYRLLKTLAYQHSEEWHMPADGLVQLGVVLEL